MMSTWRYSNRSVRMCSMFSSEPVSKLSTHRTRWPRASSSSHRCEPRKPAPPVTRQVGMAANLPAAAHDMLVAASHRHPLGVQVRQQSDGELARAAERVADLRDGDRSAGTAGQLNDLPLGL